MELKREVDSLRKVFETQKGFQQTQDGMPDCLEESPWTAGPTAVSRCASGLRALTPGVPLGCIGEEGGGGLGDGTAPKT